MNEKMMAEQAPDAILCLGGDGTIASVAEALSSSTFSNIRNIPIVPVPTGLANGMCSSLGISRIVVRGEGDGKRIFENVFNAQTTRSVPLWRVTIRDEHSQVYMDMRAIGTVGMGLYPHWIASTQRLLTLADFMPMLPSLGPRPAMGVAFGREVLTREQRMPVKLEVQRDGGGGWETIEEDAVQLCVASQFSHQQSLLSLTPHGSFSASTGPYLGVTLANTTASRMRLAHLFMKEGYVGGGSRWSLDIAKSPTHRSIDSILEEDGVHRLDKVIAMRWTNLSDSINVMVVVDGEPVRLPPGLSLEVSRCSPREQVNIVV